jgi:hypothetical protein
LAAALVLAVISLVEVIDGKGVQLSLPGYYGFE